MDSQLPPNQRWAAPGRWPVVGEKAPRSGDDSPWTLTIAGLVSTPTTWTLSELHAMTCVDQSLDIHCVTRWSKPSVTFRGILLARLFESVTPSERAGFVWMQARSDRNHSTSIPWDVCVDSRAMVAWEADGTPLSETHGGPLRIVVPGRYFYKSLKWVERIELLASDRLGWWEAEAGYHNGADPWREERYMARGLDRADVARLVAMRDVRGLDLLGFDGSDRDLSGFRAQDALLRDSRFARSELPGADFSRANVSNAHFRGAVLRNACFVGTDCEGADFSECDLSDADFQGASLFGATFDGALLAGTRFDVGVDPFDTA
jgi:DMSO/TMAO reductase YedYZ molybdopterin-dependent catalytic subunit